MGIDIGDSMNFHFTKEEVEWERSRSISGEEGGKFLEFENGTSSSSYQR